jgi:hypothetical protein
MKDEGDLLVAKGRQGADRVLECHESGPEIVVYLAAATAAVALAKSVLDLILFVLNARSEVESPRAVARFKITTRRIGRTGSEEQRHSVEVSLPLSDDSFQSINDLLPGAVFI